MPSFHPREKVRKTTTLPVQLLEELGLPAVSRKPSRPHLGGNRFTNNPSFQRPLSIIGKGQSAVKGAPRGSKPQQSDAVQTQQQASSSSKNKLDTNKRKLTLESHDEQQQTDSKKKKSVLKQTTLRFSSSSSFSKKDENNTTPSTESKQMRINPFTGEMEQVKDVNKNKHSKLEKMLAKSEAGTNGKAKQVETLKKKNSSMTQTEKDEEKEIAWLESQLGKAKNDSDEIRDELDEFLDDLDRFHVGMFDSGDEEDQGSDDESLQGSEDEFESDLMSSDDESERLDSGSDLEEDDSVDESDLDMNQDDDEQDDVSQAETDGEQSSESGNESKEQKGDLSAKPVEFLPQPTSGRYIPPALRAKMAAEAAEAGPGAGAGTGTTSASSNSAPTTNSSPENDLTQQKLRRQAQGLLNRLGDGNIDTIVSEFEALYRSYSRANVSSTITQLVLDTVTSRSNLIDTFVILHAAFVAALHKVIGVEFAASFISRMVEELTNHYSQLQNSDLVSTPSTNVAATEADDGSVKGKECLNLTVLACELYNLQVVACPLIYDLIRLFLGQEPGGVASTTHSVTETDVELLLKAVRCSGHQLRHDDPSSLKAIISLTQQLVSSSSSSSSNLSSRTKFMLERLNDLKNNSSKFRGGGVTDPNDSSSASGQLLTRMKKYLGGMSKKRTVRSYEPLRISLKDLQDADKKGKWWLVGAAWTGQTDQTDAQGLTKMLPMNATSDAIQSLAAVGRGHGGGGDDGLSETKENQQKTQLLSLARKQGMNTDARRTIFITVLTSEDYQDAAQKLLSLKLNEVQRREIIRVLINCVGSENLYNPYYVLIGQQLTLDSYTMKITLQYCLWDFLRELGEKEVGGKSFTALTNNDNDDDDDEKAKQIDPRRISNLSRCYGWWISRDCISLSVFKVIDFTVIRPKPIEFLQQVLFHLLLSTRVKSPSRTFVVQPNSRIQVNKLQDLVNSGLIGNLDLSRGFLFFLKSKLTTKHTKKLVLGHGTPKQAPKLIPVLELVDAGVEIFIQLVEACVNQSSTTSALEQGKEDQDVLQSDIEM